MKKDRSRRCGQTAIAWDPDHKVQVKYPRASWFSQYVPEGLVASQIAKIQALSKLNLMLGWVAVLQHLSVMIFWQDSGPASSTLSFSSGSRISGTTFLSLDVIEGLARYIQN